MNILVMRTCGDEDGVFTNSECAIVKIDKPLVRLLKKNLALARAIKKKNDSFFSMDLRDWSPRFVSSGTLEKMLGTILPQGWEDAGHAVVKVQQQDLDALLAGSEVERLEYCCLTVTDDMFWWSATPKHSTLNITTMPVDAKNGKELDAALSAPKGGKPGAAVAGGEDAKLER